MKNRREERSVHSPVQNGGCGVGHLQIKTQYAVWPQVTLTISELKIDGKETDLPNTEAYFHYRRLPSTRHTQQHQKKKKYIEVE